MARKLGSVLAASCLTLLAGSAGAQQLRFTKTTTGGLAVTGNTLGLSKALDQNGPGTRDSIGTFIALDPTSVDNVPLNSSNPWPTGTTWDWTKNGSTNTLSLPAGATVEYAELIWAGSHQYVTDVSAHLGTAVTLRAGGASVSVLPSTATALTIAQQSTTGFFANYYMRSADVTSFVASQGAGAYTVSGVPATEDTTINSLNAAGWTLVVAYTASASPARNISIFVGGSFVDENSQQDYTFSGFCTPPAGPVEGTAIVTALEGDANLTGDQLLIGQTTGGSFVNLSAPNNPANNFFASQINGASGQLDTGGSFGTVNHNAAGGVNVSGARQGWDLTTVQLSSADGKLANGQTSAVLRNITTGDSYVPVLGAFTIDVTAPDFSDGSSLLTSTQVVSDGDTFTVTAVIKNSGDVPADIEFVMPLDSGLSLAGYTTDGNSGDIGGQAVSGGMLSTGVAAGTIASGQSRTVVLTLDVVGPPATGSDFPVEVSWNYSYVSCVGQPAISAVWPMPSAKVSYEAAAPDAGAGGAGNAGGAGGSAGAGASAASGGAAASGGGGGKGVPDSGDDGSCACSAPGAGRSTGASLLAGLGMLLGLWRTRRRRG